MDIEALDWGWRYARRTDPAVRGVSFRMDPSERILLLGPSGVGKSTLLLALAGILGSSDEGEETGTLLIDGVHPSRVSGTVGLVQQDPQTQLVMSRVGDDVAFGCENLRVAPDAIWPRVYSALDLVGLDVALNRPTHALSGGQQQRLAVAGALAMLASDTDRPRLLLLDEPTSNLDPEGVRGVHDAVGAAVAERHLGLIIVEHQVGVWLDLIDRVIVLGAGGGILADGPPERVFADRAAELLAAGVWIPNLHPDLPSPRPLEPTPEPALWTEQLTIGYEPDHPVQRGLDVSVPRSRSTVITGPNGVGKSTLALTLAGLLPALDGSVCTPDWLQPTRATPVLDPIRWRSVELLTRIGTVFQSPEHQFVTNRVFDELAIGPRALKWPKPRIQERIDELLAKLHLSELADASPFALSGGQQRRLSVGTVLASEPELIVLDEPTFGQDRNTWIDLVRLASDILADGKTIISVTHDAEFIRALGEHRIELVP